MTRDEQKELNELLDQMALEMVHGASVDIESDPRSARISELMTRGLMEGVDGAEPHPFHGMKYTVDATAEMQAEIESAIKKTPLTINI